MNKEDKAKVKLFNWIDGILNVNDIVTNQKLIPIQDLIEECLTKGKSELKSS